MGLSADDKLLLEGMEIDFDYHASEAATTISACAKDLGRRIIERCPAGRKRSKALAKLEQSLFWANAALAEREAK